MPSARFADRRDGGRRLSALLGRYAHDPGVVVLAVPRGGVPVGYEVARALGVPLDICTVRKLGLPGHVELAMGAIASGGVWVLNEDLVQRVGISRPAIARIAARELEEIARREREYRGSRPATDPRGKTVLLVDDGLATGATMRAAVKSLRAQQAQRIVVGVPVGAPRTCGEIKEVADELVCVAVPATFRAVGLWYDDFEPTTDEEVKALLDAASRAAPPGQQPAAPR